MKVIPDDIGTKSIDRRDLGIMDQCCLLLQMFIVRIFVQCLIDRIGDSLFHFSCRRSCKCHDQKPVDIHRPFWIHDLT